MTHYVKLTNEKCCHNGFKYEEGLNTDIHPFNTERVCDKGGLYFCRYQNFAKWINYSNEYNMYWIWDVTIPERTEVIDMGDKLKAHSITLSNKRSIWDNKELCLEAVKHNGYALWYVKKQTEELCLEAVKQDGQVLKYVKEQTTEICLEAVKQNGCALKYVKEQTTEICLEAIKQDGYALFYVEEHTEEICLEAVKQNGRALMFVKEQTEEICLEAVKQNGDALNYVKAKFYDICKEYLNKVKS
jgi:hypothetical protein